MREDALGDGPDVVDRPVRPVLVERALETGDVARGVVRARPAEAEAVIEALDRYGEFFGDELTVEHPTGSGRRATLTEVADDLRRRLIAIFLLDDEGRRPCFGDVARFRDDPAWRDALLFHEYFHGDLGCGLGASHQTGWTGLVADLIATRAAARG